MEHLAAELKERHPDLARRIAGTIVVDEHHMTEDQLLAEGAGVLRGEKRLNEGWVPGYPIARDGTELGSQSWHHSSGRRFSGEAPGGSPVPRI